MLVIACRSSLFVVCCSLSFVVVYRLLLFCGVKPGHGTFLAWHYPLEKVFLTHTAELVRSLSDIFTLTMIIDWSDLKGTSSADGRLSAIKVK